MTVYQIAEATGTLRAEDVREALTPADLCEWAVYLNSPFSTRGRDAMMNGWLVHVIRSMVADKRHKPKFSDSMFPFPKIAQEFFAEAKKNVRPVPSKKQPVCPLMKGVPRTMGEVQHLAQLVSRNYEQAMADYRAGKIPNKAGLYVNQRVRK